MADAAPAQAGGTGQEIPLPATAGGGTPCDASGRWAGWQVFAGVAEKLEEPELEELRKTYEARVNSRFPAAPQLRQQPRMPEAHDESMFLV